jgi:hypothetical protein
MTTVRDQILDNLVTTLQSIVTPTYSNTMKIASREIKHWEDVGRFPASYVTGDIEKLSRGDVKDRINALWTVEILVYVKHRKNLSDEIESLIGDVRTAIFVDRTRGGLALDTVINNITNMSKWIKPIGIFTAELNILYEYDKGTP